MGINQDGSFNKAHDLVSEAAICALKLEKFQYRNLENTSAKTGHQEIGDEILQTEIYKNYLWSDELNTISGFARKLGLEVGISFFDVKELLDFEGSKTDFDFFAISSPAMRC